MTRYAPRRACCAPAAGDDLRRHLGEEARSIAALADGPEAQDRMASFLTARGRPKAGDGRAADRESESVS